MAQTTIKVFAEQIGISTEKLLTQLGAAGIPGKKAGDSLSDEEKMSLLSFLRGDAEPAQGRSRVTLKQRKTSELKVSSRTGSARTVQVQVKKKRTFVKRSAVEEVEQKEAEEKARLQAIEDEKKKQAEEQARLAKEAEEKAREAEALAKREAEEAAAAQEAALKAQAENQASAKKAPPPAPEKKTEPVRKKAAPEPKTADKKRKRRGGEQRLHLRAGQRGRRTGGFAKRTVKTSLQDHVFEKPVAPVVRDVAIPETISVGDLAAAMHVKAAEVIKTLMGMGFMATINQMLDRDTATLVVEEMGHVAKEAAPDTPESLLEEEELQGETTPRAPVVTVMGHVDHGKTSLLDHIRKAKVASGEAGGITQHIGAYNVKTSHGAITFLDTPGHEAFSAMRARGAKVTDIVILIVAADDGVKPQTIEAIKHARDAEVPMVVAINKIDKPEADLERIKNELVAQEVVPEDWGGDVQFVPLSAKTGEGVEDLLESLSLLAEVLELKAVAEGAARGMVVESRLDKGRGAVATILVQEGELKRGDVVLAGREWGKVRAMRDDAGKTVNSAGPSIPVEVQGLSGVPVAGDTVMVVSDERKARQVAEYRHAQYKEKKAASQQASKLDSLFERMEQGEAKSLNVLIKGDVHGSVEALTDSLNKLSTDEVKVNVVHSMVGGINESDINLAMASDALIIGFNVRADGGARNLAEKEGVEIRYYSVIYDVVNDISDALVGMLDPLFKEEIIGLAEVRDVFKAPKIGQIAGCMVLEGVVRKDAPIRVLRDNVVIFEGALESLRRFKDDVQEVKSGTECGIGVKDYKDVQPGDQIEVFEKTEVKREL
ncbi:MAG: translation initiation factor IF-2 [Gammaproteobacteria bacterium]|nr:MAG: translation initiation factor IF-2 [Gammaproteobacteria bacterium]